ncbi:MAG: hypothetical protein ACHQVS_04260 [Candidatus Babeliales bacterium]
MKWITVFIGIIASPMFMQAADQSASESSCFCFCSTEKQKIARAEKALRRHPNVVRVSLRTNSVELAQDVAYSRAQQHKNTNLNSPSAKVELDGRRTLSKAAYGLKAQELAEQARNQQEGGKEGEKITLSKRMTIGEQLKVVHMKGEVEHSRRSHSARSRRGQHRGHEDVTSLQTQVLDDISVSSPRPKPRALPTPVKFTFVDTLPNSTVPVATIQLPGVPDDTPSEA